MGYLSVIASASVWRRSRLVRSLSHALVPHVGHGQDQEPPDAARRKTEKKTGLRNGRSVSTRRTQPTGQVIPQLMKKFNLNDKLQELLEQAGLKWNPVKLVHICLAGFLVGYAVWLCCFLPLEIARVSLWSSAALAALLPLLYVIGCGSTRLQNSRRCSRNLEFISRSMRAGHAFSVSLEMIHREFPEPLSGEFRRTFEEHNLGLAARRRAAEVWPSAFPCSTFISLFRPCCCRSAPAAIWPRFWTSWPTSSANDSSCADESAPSARTAR